MVISREQVTGNNPGLKTTNELHFNENGLIKPREESKAAPFSQVLLDAVNQTDAMENDYDDLEKEMVLNPEKVDVHEVMIASEKARMSLSFLKSITEKAMKAYNDIMMLR